MSGFKKMGGREMGGHWSSEEERQVSTVREKIDQGQVQKENTQNASHLRKPHG